MFIVFFSKFFQVQTLSHPQFTQAEVNNNILGRPTCITLFQVMNFVHLGGLAILGKRKTPLRRGTRHRAAVQHHLHRRAKMGFSDLPTEIRLEIYSELLVLSEPIDFLADRGPLSPPLFRSRRHKLHPAVLRVSRMVHGEASPLLYSNNCFRFPEVYGPTMSAPTHAHIAPFLAQIGLQARLIRRICIPFPTFNYPVPDEARLHEVHINNLELIRKSCTNIETLELLIPPDHSNYALYDWATAAEALNILNTHLRSIHSLKDIIVNFEEYPECDPSDDLTKKMRDLEWTIMITRLPKRVWISCDGRVEFDNEEDCNVYNSEQLRIELEMEEEREREEWREEYYRRRRDPYWKNDSDYD